MGLGGLSTVPLADARERASAARRILKDGQKPIEQRRLARAEPEKAVTFGAFADQIVADRSHGFRNDKHKAQWTSTLATYAAALRLMPVDAIGTADVLAGASCGGAACCSWPRRELSRSRSVCAA